MEEKTDGEEEDEEELEEADVVRNGEEGGFRKRALG